MHQLSEIIQKAIQAVGKEYFHLPIDGAPNVYRERVYCYELYHHIRLLWPDNSEYRLNGEIDKIGHPYFSEDSSKPKPDFLIHAPGTNKNFAVIEVKTVQGVERFEKDIATLTRFVSSCGYQKAIYIIYGDDISEKIIGEVKEAAKEIKNFELWINSAPGFVDLIK